MRAVFLIIRSLCRPAVPTIAGFPLSLPLPPSEDVLFAKRNGWLITWSWCWHSWASSSTFAPASGSIEGMVFTMLPIGGQLIGLMETLASHFFFRSHVLLGHTSK